MLSLVVMVVKAEILFVHLTLKPVTKVAMMIPMLLIRLMKEAVPRNYCSR